MEHPITRRAAIGGGLAVAAGALLSSEAVPAFASTPAGPVQAGITVERVKGLSRDFALGVDVSSVLSLEEAGVVFRDAAGRPADLLRVIAQHGANAMRVRVWNDPFDDVTHQGYGGGNVSVPRAIQIGRRATAAGLGVWIDFHYSDFWADPARQLSPKAWAGFTVAQTAAAMYDFTVQSLRSFKAAGVRVIGVQIGNETSNGIAGYTRPGEDIDANFATLIKAGAAGVRKVLPRAKVAVHFTNPETEGRYATYAAGLHSFGVDYDVFASSYYPYYHGTLANLSTVLSQVSKTYHKQIAVVETAWPWTLNDGDGFPNSIGEASQVPEYPVSVQGQATELHDVVATVAGLGEAAIGVYFWEPAWIPVGPPSDLAHNMVLWEKFGAGWATSAASAYDPVNVGQFFGGSAEDNQSLIGWDGIPLESLSTFRYLRTGSVARG